MDVRPSLPPAVGRADLVRAGLDKYGANRDLATWFGFDYRASTARGALVDDGSEARSSRAGGPAEATAVDESGGPAILCRQSITFSREDTGEDRTPTADTTTWLNRPKQPPRFLPLGTSQRTKRLLEPLLDLTSERGSADIKRVVNTLARAQPLSRIPRRERTNFAETLQCVVDRSTRLTTFLLDQTFVVEQVRRLFPQVSLLIWVYEEAAHAFNALTAATPDSPDPALGPLLVLGDLGTYATLEARTMWRQLARSFVFEGGRAGAMLPCSSEEVSLTEVGPWELLPWEGDARVPPRASDLERLVSFASAAIRLDPGLLRAIRKEILPETSASLEIEVWKHAAISSRSVEAASFDPKLRAVYHGRLSELSKREPKAVRTCLKLIREWRHLTSDEIWYEEILGLPKVIRDDASFVDPMDIATANTFFAALRQGASQGSLEPGHEAWLARAGRRQQRDGLWQNPNAAAAMKSALESDPNFVPPVIVDTEVDREDWHAHIALDGEGGLWLSSAPLAGQSLGTIAMRGGDFEVLSPDRKGRQVAAGRVTTDGKQLRLETPQPPFVILSARGAVEVDQVRPQDFGWASAVSSDSVGPWADLRLGDALLRFRWVPPGRGIVGSGSADEAAEELAQGKPGTTVPVRGRQTEVVFSRGFWLMERPISRGDMSAILGERSEPSEAALPAVEVSIEDVTAVFERVRTVNWDTRLRLPSPTEWEYACRARVLDQTTYFGTPNLSDAYDKTLSQIAWFSPSDDMLGRRDLRRLEGPMRSMQKKANPWGLFDMLGNVAEWCLDASSQAEEQPVKGGSFRHGPESIRAAYVEHVAQQSRLDWVGFRPALGESEIESLRQITPPRSKYIERNRAPRVQIAYEVEHYGSPTAIELPFVMGVMADLGGVSETAEASKPVTERAFRDIDADRFPKFMASLKPRVKARVNYTLPQAEGEEHGEELAIDLSFESMDDFAPDEVAEQIPQLAKLLRVRRQLVELLGVMDGRIDAEKHIAQLLNDERLLGQIAARRSTPRRRAEVGQTEKAGAPDAPEATAIDVIEYMEQLGKDLRVNEVEGERLEALVRNLAVAAQGRSETTPVSSNPTMSIKSLISGIDKLLTKQMNEVLHAPEVREMEGTWRGLWYLVNNTETDQKLKIRVMNISKNELAGTLEEFEGQLWDQSPVFRKVYTDEYSMFGGEPFGCLIGGYEFSNHPKDVGLLRNLSGICALAHTPFIAAASPLLFRMESWQELPNPRDLQQIVSNPAYASWQSLRESEDARHIGLTMPRVLARLPYGAETVPVKGFAFEEEVAGDHHNFVWMNAAFPMGVNINRSHKLFGWGAQIRGVESGGAVLDLPAHTFPTDDGSMAMKGPTEVAIDDRREAELAKLGLMPILHLNGTNVAAFIGAHSLQDDEARAGRLVDPDAQANERLSANLPYLFPVSRFAHYLKAIARDKIGSFKERADMQVWLTEWINRYVLANPAFADDKDRAKRPLAAAEVQVDSVEGRPGYYNARFYLRPHYQLEGINASLRLVSELPSVKQ